MSRSFGDLVAQECGKAFILGVITIPEITHHVIDEDDLYLVICSDGVWEFLQNQDVYNETLNLFYSDDPDAICKTLYELSHKLWIKEDDAIDDITALTVFLNN